MRTLSTTLLLGLLTVGAHAQSTLNVVLDSRSDVTAARGADTRRVAFVDVDADGDLDLFNLNYEQANVLFLNDGTGAFALDTTIGNPLLDDSIAKGVAFGDLDGDGDEDAFIANGNDRPNRLLRNLSNDGGPAGLFEVITPAEMVATQDHSYQGAFGDLDGDGDLDLVVVNRYQENELWLGDGAGGLVRDPGSALSVGAFGSRDVELADLDLDGDLDLVVANSTDADNEVWVNRGGAQEGQFDLLAGDPSTSDGGTSYAVAVGDLDGDGLPEIVVGNRLQVGFLYANVTVGGDLAFERVLSGPFDPFSEAGDVGDTYGVALADVDGNGEVDIAMANRAVKNFLYLATGESEFDYLKVTTGQFVEDRGNSRDVQAADLDDDGLPELVVGNTRIGRNRLFDNLGPVWIDLGNALPGSSGAPRLAGLGELVPRTELVLRVEDAAADSLASVFVSPDLGLFPFAGGVLVPDLSTGLSVGGYVTAPDGSLEIKANWPQAATTGELLFVQIGVADAGAVQGIALTNGLQARSQ